MTPAGAGSPERAARARIDAALGEAGGVVQDRGQMNLSAGHAIKAVSEDLLPRCAKDGTTVNSIDFEKLLRYEIPLAPGGEQIRIVVLEPLDREGRPRGRQ